MNSSSTNLSVKVTVTGLGVSESNGGFVRLKIEGHDREIAEVFSFDDLASQPKLLFNAVRHLGEPLITQAAKAGLINHIQDLVRKAQGEATMPTFKVVSRVGWFGDSFATPSRLFPMPDPNVVVSVGNTHPIMNYERRRSLNWAAFSMRGVDLRNGKPSSIKRGAPTSA